MRERLAACQQRSQSAAVGLKQPVYLSGRGERVHMSQAWC